MICEAVQAAAVPAASHCVSRPAAVFVLGDKGSHSAVLPRAPSCSDSCVSHGQLTLINVSGFLCSEPELKTEAVTGTSSGLNSDMADAFRKLAGIVSGACPPACCSFSCWLPLPGAARVHCMLPSWGSLHPACLPLLGPWHLGVRLSPP